MVITSRSDSPLQVITVEIQPPRPVQHYENDIQMSTEEDSNMLPQVDLTTDTLDMMSSTPSSSSPEESSTVDLDFSQPRRYFQQVGYLHYVVNISN